MTDMPARWHRSEQGYWNLLDERGHTLMRVLLPGPGERRRIMEAYIEGVRRGQEMAQPPLPIDSMDLASRVSRAWP